MTHEKGAKHGDGGEEMPDVVIIKEGEQDALSVVLTRLSWSFLQQDRGETSDHTDMTIDWLNYISNISLPQCSF